MNFDPSFANCVNNYFDSLAVIRQLFQKIQAKGLKRQEYDFLKS